MSGRLSLLTVALLAGAAVSATPRATACCPTPNAVVALGGGASAAPDSWSTSSSAAVGSHYLRYAKLFKKGVTAYTFATGGFSVADLEAQARLAVRRAPNRYTTVELGVRDLCSGTPPETFAARLDRGLRVLSKVRKGSFNVNPILVMSIEDLAREWLVLPRALRSGQSLACGLGSSATPARLARIRARTIALNDAIARVCFRNRDCLYDRGTRFRMPVEAGYFSPTALGGLSVAGQRAVAAAEWGPAQILLRHVG